jgi:hypothetical protein
VAESAEIADKLDMDCQPFRRLLLLLAAAGLLLSGYNAVAQDANSDYAARLAQYLQAREAYDVQATSYWDAVADKRRVRNAKRREHQPMALTDYVLTQPPVYAGPPRPVSPAGPGPLPGEAEKPPIPVIADFLSAAQEQFGFVPDRPGELDFKRAYAAAALRAGLTRDQIVGIYAFETGGNGTYDMQAGVSSRPNSRAISPAVGYNQLLSTNSVSLLAEHGAGILTQLRQQAKALRGDDKATMEAKIEAFKRMLAACRALPHRWSDYDSFAKTTPAGWGIHAAVLDRDIGPLLQVRKLTDSVHFARAKGYGAPLTAAELELMNLTGDGNGIDMVMMPAYLRTQVPTANFFQQNGYERNPVARRTGVVANLIASIEDKMASASHSQGAKDMAAAF